jgi:transposase
MSLRLTTWNENGGLREGNGARAILVLRWDRSEDRPGRKALGVFEPVGETDPCVIQVPRDGAAREGEPAYQVLPSYLTHSILASVQEDGMDVVNERCCGLDVHQALVVACVLVPGSRGKPRKEIRSFSTVTQGLRELMQWLQACSVTHVAMESTGVYWLPIYALLEEHFDLTVANAQHIKNVPGRKTDVKDAEWIAQLLRLGLLRKSFVPSEEFRAIRDLVRYRRSLVQDRTREVNRLQKVLVLANVKLRTVISDVFGVSGLKMVRALIEGTQSPAQIARLALGTMRKKIPQIEQALEAQIADHHRQLLRMQLARVDQIDAHLETLDVEIARRFKPYEAQLTLLDTIPGVDRKVAEAILAEIGVDMTAFADAAKLAAWSGTSPGNHQSAGKNLGSRHRKGNVHLTTTLVEAAHAARNTKGTYLGDKYHRLKARRGAKRAALAIGRKIIEAVWHMLAHGVPYQELGAAFLDQRDHTRVVANLQRRIERLGYHVTLAPVDPTPPEVPNAA